MHYDLPQEGSNACGHTTQQTKENQNTKNKGDMKQHERNREKQEDQSGGYKAAEAADNRTSYMEEEFKGDVADELLNTKCSTKFERKVKTMMKDVPIRFKSPRN